MFLSDEESPPLSRLFDLTGRTALVTGGGRGIGREFSKGLAEAGAHVLVASRKIDNCQNTVAEITEIGGSAEAAALDVSDIDSIDAFLASRDDNGRYVDLLINNGGITWGSYTLEHPLAAWDKVYNTNLRGLWHLTQQVARRLKELDKPGVIVNISSIAGLRGTGDGPASTVAYSSSKAALIGLTTDLAVKLAPLKIRVNGIAPGFFLTDMFKFVKDNEPAINSLRARVPQGREGSAGDLRGAVVYLCSDASSYVTGQTLVIDGGASSVLMS